MMEEILADFLEQMDFVGESDCCPNNNPNKSEGFEPPLSTIHFPFSILYATNPSSDTRHSMAVTM